MINILSIPLILVCCLAIIVLVSFPGRPIQSEPAPVTPVTIPTSPNLTLIRVGRDLGVKSIDTGKQQDDCQRMAERQAAYQARVKVQGHQLWESRVQELYQAMPDCDSFSEVCAESWPGQDLESAAREMYHSWSQSRGRDGKSGHWGVVDGKCDYWGYSMVRSSNGVWYATGVCGYKRTTK